MLSFSAASCSESERQNPSLKDRDAESDAHLGSGGSPGNPVTPAPEGQPYETLAEWNLFTDPVAQVPNDRVIPYAVNSELFANYTTKHRFLYVPDGATIGYEPESVWRFPVGTILIKTFAHPEPPTGGETPERLLETRLLVRETDAWRAHTYVWNETQTEARAKVAGARMMLTSSQPDGTTREALYVVPNLNECRECHGQNAADTLGGRTRQLNRLNDYGDGPVNQIDYLASLGLFDAPPPAPADSRQSLVDPNAEGPLEDRVRAYLDANCGHCHNPSGKGDSGSGLHLNYESTDPATRVPGNVGICKIPTSAGGATCDHTFDIVPGDPDRSILMCRLSSEESQVMMPPLGRTVAHAEGAALLREWISGLEGACP